MKQWFLVMTKLKSEHKAMHNLLAKHGIHSFAPFYPPAKKSSATGLPLFPRYLFVQCNLELEYQKVQYTPGILKMVRFGEKLIPVEDSVVNHLIELCDSNGQLDLKPIKTGQEATIKAGMFKGYHGIIQEKRGNMRVQMLLNLAYYTTQVDVPISHIEITSHKKG